MVLVAGVNELGRREGNFNYILLFCSPGSLPIGNGVMNCSQLTSTAFRIYSSIDFNCLCLRVEDPHTKKRLLKDSPSHSEIHPSDPRHSYSKMRAKVSGIEAKVVYRWEEFLFAPSKDVKLSVLAGIFPR